MQCRTMIDNPGVYRYALRGFALLLNCGSTPQICGQSDVAPDFAKHCHGFIWIKRVFLLYREFR